MSWAVLQDRFAREVSLRLSLTMKSQRLLLLLLTPFMLTALVAVAQESVSPKDPTPKQRLRSHSTVKGFIGGESHDSYVIRGRKGQTLNVQISWQHDGENHCEFTVSESPDGYSGEPVPFGSFSNGEKRWTGKIPMTREYYIYVVAYPSAHYKLRVTLKP